MIRFWPDPAAGIFFCSVRQFPSELRQPAVETHAARRPYRPGEVGASGRPGATDGREAALITLYKFGPAWGASDLSPFCTKVDAYLRMRGIPFETAVGDSRKAPKGKLPYLVDDGVTIADSRDIIAHLEAKADAPLDAGISPGERALGTAYRALLEEELYFHVVYQRWQLDSGWSHYVPRLKQYAGDIGAPTFLAPLLLPAIRRQVVRNLHGQGMGRHTPEQVEGRAREALEALSTQLGDGPYFLGERPRTIDATVFAFLVALMAGPFESKCKQYALAQPNFVAYVERIKAAYF